MVDSTTCFDTNESPLPCREHRPARFQAPARKLTGFYSGHTPTLRRLNHLDDSKALAPNPGTGYQPAAAELPALVISFTLRITLLSRFREGRQPYVQLSRAGIVSIASRYRLRDHFRGPNVEASPYPSAEVFRYLAPSSARFTGKPSRASRG